MWRQLISVNNGDFGCKNQKIDNILAAIFLHSFEKKSFPEFNAHVCSWNEPILFCFFVFFYLKMCDKSEKCLLQVRYLFLYLSGNRYTLKPIPKQPKIVIQQNVNIMWYK